MGTCWPLIISPHRYCRLRVPCHNAVPSLEDHFGQPAWGPTTWVHNLHCSLGAGGSRPGTLSPAFPLQPRESSHGPGYLIAPYFSRTLCPQGRLQFFFPFPYILVFLRARTSGKNQSLKDPQTPSAFNPTARDPGQLLLAGGEGAGRQRESGSVGGPYFAQFRCAQILITVV